MEISETNGGQVTINGEFVSVEDSEAKEQFEDIMTRFHIESKNENTCVKEDQIFQKKKEESEHLKGGIFEEMKKNLEKKYGKKKK